MPATVFTIERAKSVSLNLTEGDKGSHAIYLTIVSYQTNRRAGTASTKSRAEVAGSGKKLWRQKGTGNARMGSRRSPIWKGGGVVWGPKPRDYFKKVNAKVRQLALRASLTARINDGDVLFVENIIVPDGKTKAFISQLNAMTDAAKVVVVGDFDEQTGRSALNVPHVLLVRPSLLNAEHVLNCQKLILTAHAIEVLVERTAKK